MGKKKSTITSPTKKVPTGEKKIITVNRRARYEYFILDTWEAGIVLVGTEVKALRASKVSLSDAFATIDNGEIWLRNLHIAEYDLGGWMNHAPKRNRKLLLHKRQILKIGHKISQNSYTLIPLSLYFLDGRVKVELALAQGKKLYDKRNALAKRQAQYDMTRTVGRRLKGAQI